MYEEHTERYNATHHSTQDGKEILNELTVGILQDIQSIWVDDEVTVVIDVIS